VELSGERLFLSRGHFREHFQVETEKEKIVVAVCSCPLWNEELQIVVAAGRTAREMYSNQKVCSTCRVVFLLIKATAMFYVSLFENIWKHKD